ncbi:hypothetical protein LTR37_002347 [Vermiconidia calcicola]|uniref:Uncharacterized protein n=1 Tax=Vermiconidia calcicola TaxID=1690605 RepID=A0ACC3NTE6_9PEZI|nr:hypothetical protein LTR37_002347 [Vermiconidia calcicola]
MDGTQQPPKKKQKLTMEGSNVPATLYDPPKQLPVSELYNPTMVKIMVSDATDDCEDDLAAVTTETFMLPKQLICSRSTYFQSVFEGWFSESQSGCLHIKNVSPWVFRVFVGWLYYQTIYLDPNRVEPTHFEPIHNDKHDQAHGQPVSHTSTSSSAAASRCPSPVASAAKSPLQATHPSASTLVDRQVAGSKSFPEQRTLTDDECDFTDPVTWPYCSLFELHIFADGYHTRAFRMQLLVIIQTKLLPEQPRQYQLPAPEAVTYAVERLPPSSPLYRLLVGCYAPWLDLKEFGDSLQKKASCLEVLPPHFLAQCFVMCKMHIYASECSICVSDESTLECQSATHSREDLLVPGERDPCSYHEHDGDDEETARCSLRWEAMRYQFQRHSTIQGGQA